MTGKKRSRRYLLTLAVAVALIVFGADGSVDLGVAVAVPYVVVVWLVYAAGSLRAVWVAAGVCSLLTLAGVILSPVDEKLVVIFGNRALTLFVIWMTAVLCHRNLRLLADQFRRTQAAEKLAADLAEQRREDVRKSRAMASIMEDLQIERERLKDSEQRLLATVESAPTAMIMIDGEGNIVLLNVETERLFGYSRDELVGRPVESLVPERFRAKHPEYRTTFFADPQARRMGAGRDLFGLRKDGSEFPVEIGLNPVKTDGGLFVLSAIADITARKQLEAEQRRLQEERERRAEIRAADLAELNEALEQSNIELQQFAYVASHDLQTPLRVIAGFSQFLQQDYKGKLDAKADDRLDRIVGGCQRMQTMINDLLSYSRVESRSRPFHATDLNEVVDDVVTLLGSSIHDSCGEVTHSELPTVFADPSQMSQLFQNLIGNGLKYYGSDPPHVHVSADSNGDQWTLCVQDNGIGIADKHHKRIFEIFRRLHTQDKYPGTGIGLAICRRIVRRHSGCIWLESHEGHGTRFFFTIPQRRNEQHEI